jgi:chromosome segregation ATPase
MKCALALLVGFTAIDNAMAIFGRQLRATNQKLTVQVEFLESELDATKDAELVLIEKVRYHRMRSSALGTEVRKLRRSEATAAATLAGVASEAAANVTAAEALAAEQIAALSANLTAAITRERARWDAARAELQAAFDARETLSAGAFEARVAGVQEQLAAATKHVADLERAQERLARSAAKGAAAPAAPKKVAPAAPTSPTPKRTAPTASTAKRSAPKTAPSKEPTSPRASSPTRPRQK